MPNSRPRLLLFCIAIAATSGGVWFFWPNASDVSHHPAVASAHPGTNKPSPVINTALPHAHTAEAAATDTTAESPQGAKHPTVGEILGDPASDDLSAARALGVMVQDPAMNLESRAEALAHLLNLSVNNEATLLFPLITSSKLPDSFLTTILNDSLNRPLKWQADVCLAVMARPVGKILYAEAREHLAFLTDQDHGEDLHAWTRAAHEAQLRWREADADQTSSN